MLDQNIQSQTEHVNTRSTYYELCSEQQKNTDSRINVCSFGLKYIHAFSVERDVKGVKYAWQKNARGLFATAWCLYIVVDFFFCSLMHQCYMLFNNSLCVIIVYKMEFFVSQTYRKSILFVRIHDELYLRTNKWVRIFRLVYTGTRTTVLHVIVQRHRSTLAQRRVTTTRTKQDTTTKNSSSWPHVSEVVRKKSSPTES